MTNTTFPNALCRPSVPTFAIGDVHGQAEIFARVLDHAAKLMDSGRAANVVILGDIIDRGPDSLLCLQLLSQFRRSYKSDLLMGNHEQLMFATLHGDNDLSDWAASNWIRNGGIWAFQNPDNATTSGITKTLSDLGLSLDAWNAYSQSGNVLFVHAGIQAGQTASQTAKFLMAPKLALPRTSGESHPHWAWIRNGFLESDTPLKDHFVVHGHTAREFTHAPRAGRFNLDASKQKAVAAALLDGNSIDLTVFMAEAYSTVLAAG